MSGKFFYFILVISLLGLIGCVHQKDETVVNDNPSRITGISVLTNDSTWVISDSLYHTVQVQVNGGGNLDSLILAFHGNSTIIFRMADDGGSVALPVANPWTSTNSGDLIPNDRIWSCRIRAGFDTVGHYSVQYIGYKVGQSWQFDTHWSVAQNRPPIFSGLVAPDSLHCGEDSALVVSVIDPDTGIANGINSVHVSIRTLLDAEVRNRALDPLGGNQSWRLQLPYTFAAGLPTATYNFVLTATDVYHATTTMSKLINIANCPPQIDSISLSSARYIGGAALFDSVQIGQSIILFDSTSSRVDSVLFVFRVVVDDPQSALDVQSLYAGLRRDSRGDTIIYNSIYLEGGPGDPIAGDGILYVGFKLDSTNRPTYSHYVRRPQDLYHITFHAFDKGNNVSPDTLFNFEIRQPSSSDIFNREQRMNGRNMYNAINPFTR